MLTQFYFNVYNYLNNLLHREEGQDLAEYAILLGLIALVGNRCGYCSWRPDQQLSSTNIGTTLASAGIPAGGQLSHATAARSAEVSQRGRAQPWAALPSCVFRRSVATRIARRPPGDVVRHLLAVEQSFDTLCGGQAILIESLRDGDLTAPVSDMATRAFVVRSFGVSTMMMAVPDLQYRRCTRMHASAGRTWPSSPSCCPSCSC